MGFSFFGKKEKVSEADRVQGDMDKTGTNANKYYGVLDPKNIKTGQKSVSKEEAIDMAGQLLVDGGYVLPEYIEAMQEREKVYSTYIGEGIAIPHGVGAAKDKIIKTGISVLQFPEGVIFGENKVAYLVVGIAGKGNEHMKILTNIAEFIQEGEAIKELFTIKDSEKIYRAFTDKL